MKSLFRATILFLLISTLAGCATEGAFRKSMNSWLGVSETDLLATAGAPAAKIKVPEGTIYEYRWSSTRYLRNSTYSNPFAYPNQYQTVGTSTETVTPIQHWCTTDFLVVNGRVQSIHLHGNWCKK